MRVAVYGPTRLPIRAGIQGPATRRVTTKPIQNADATAPAELFDATSWTCAAYAGLERFQKTVIQFALTMR